MLLGLAPSPCSRDIGEAKRATSRRPACQSAAFAASQAPSHSTSHHRNRRSTAIPALADAPLHPHSTTRSSPISPCPISESRLPQTHLTKPSPKGNSHGPREHHFGPLFAAYLRERSRSENGLISFTYDHDYDGPALSTNIPVSNRTYGQQVMNPYLFGLLPDSEDQRKAIATEFDVRPNNPVALLSHIGLDCPGGVQFCAEEGRRPASRRRIPPYRRPRNCSPPKS